jgi:ABC-type glutathione transport system ATPase component
MQLVKYGRKSAGVSRNRTWSHKKCYKQEAPRDERGQRQCVAIALARGPAGIHYRDKPVPAINALVRAQILNALLEPEGKKGIAGLFIFHGQRRTNASGIAGVYWG